jgi:8-oxo-dGTP diphosphatase
VFDGQVLLLRRARDPWKGHWDLPGGFCEPGEHPMQTVERELAEETGLAGKTVRYLGSWMDVYGPPAPDGLQETTVNIVYLVELEGNSAAIAVQGNEVLEAKWFSFADLPEELAFPRHLPRVLRAAAEATGLGRELGELPDRP